MDAGISTADFDREHRKSSRPIALMLDCRSNMPIWFTFLMAGEVPYCQHHADELVRGRSGSSDRVAEGARLEIVCASKGYRGFESILLSHAFKARGGLASPRPQRLAPEMALEP